MSFLRGIEHSLKLNQVILGMVIDIKVVTDTPGYNFKLTVHHQSRDEQLISEHALLIAGPPGASLSDIKEEYFGKHILTACDEHGYALEPLRGRNLRWSNERKLFVSPLSEFEVYIKTKTGPSTPVGVFNWNHKKKFTLPMPTKGWKLTLLDFIDKDGRVHKFLFDGTKEKE